MATLNLRLVPEALHATSPQLELSGEASNCVRQVPGMLGWSAHAELRSPEHPLRTHVCASTYDDVNIDVPPPRVAALYDRHPQPSTFISLAGMPDALAPNDAIERMAIWGVSTLPTRDWGPTLSPSTVYVARPIFLLHNTDAGYSPVAMVACRYEIAQMGLDRVDVDVGLDAIAVHPNHRHQGLAHMVLLEASRWLGMLTRSVLFDESASLVLRQRLHAHPVDAVGYHLAQAFLSNFTHFAITEELVENARAERHKNLHEPGHLRAGLASIRRLVGVEDLVQIPNNAFDFIEPDVDPTEIEYFEMTYQETEEDEC